MELEDELGVRLINRTLGGSVLQNRAVSTINQVWNFR
jgi:hypothetical protein